MDNILEISNLYKKYKNFKLDNISFSLEKGYVMGLIGTNGAGKSTIIRAIMNCIKKDSGEIKVFGLDSVKDEVKIKDRVGFVNDENIYIDEISIEKMKNLVRPFYSKWNEEEFNKYIKEFNLDPKKKIKKLSKGMKMKFSIVMALCHEADLIIMDEPTAGLDPVFRREILQILHYLMEDENKGILFSTHITSDLDKIADYITFIQNGKLVFTKSKEDIDDSYVIVKGSKEALLKLDKELLIGYKENAFGFEGLSKEKEAIREIIGDKVHIEKANLEDIMVNYSLTNS